MKLFNYLVFLLCISQACIDVIPLNVPAEENQLVIDAVLTNVPEQQTITLSFSTALLAKDPFEITRDKRTSTAVVTVQNKRTSQIFNFKNDSKTELDEDGRVVEVGIGLFHWLDTVFDPDNPDAPLLNEFDRIVSKDSLGKVGDELTLKIVFEGNTYTATNQIET